MIMNLRRTPRAERGFTLTEIAIVLGIIGLILGAIWAAASAVYSNMKVSQGEQGITSAAQAVRSMFAASNNTGAGSAGATITTPGMLPVSWTTGSAYGNPWASSASGNTFAYVLGDNTAGNTSDFAIELDGVDGAGCAALLNYFSSTAAGTNGGQVTGLVGAAWVTGAPVAGTAKAKSAAKSNWATGVASNCVNTAPGTAGTAGNNNIAIWFDMTKM